MTILPDVLAKLGLGDKDTRVFLALLEQPSVRAADLAKRIRMARTTVQNLLLRLERKGLAMQVGEERVQRYAATHPESILHLVRAKNRETRRALEETEAELETIMPQIIGMMDSAKAIPQIRFFRGKEGARQVLFDTLSAKTELKDFANIDTMFEVIQDINDEYVAAREKSSATKRSLLLDTPFARKIYQSGKYSPKSHRGYKWINSALYPFTIEMNIYDGKVSYLTYVHEDIIGVIIENDYIYRMHDSMWNLLWDVLPEVRR